MSDLLDSMIPACESALSTTLDPLFKIFRDDGLGVVLDTPDIVAKIRDFFKAFNPDIQWTIPDCSLCSVPLVAYPHYWSERSACTALGCWHKHRWQL